MAIIGFFALLLIGGYLAFATIATFIVNLGVTGHAGYGWLPPGIVAALVLWYAFTHSPITFTLAAA